MKTEITDSDYGTWFEITPETPAEVALLARCAINTCAKKPEIYLRIDGNSPSLSLSLYKVKKNAQRSSINPKDR